MLWNISSTITLNAFFSFLGGSGTARVVRWYFSVDITDRAPTFSATERTVAPKSFAGFAWGFSAGPSTPRPLQFADHCASAGVLPDAMLSCIGPIFVTIAPPRAQTRTTLPHHL